jgi:hypothetical protein
MTTGIQQLQEVESNKKATALKEPDLGEDST